MPRMKKDIVEDVSHMPAVECRKSYEKLATAYHKITEGYYCHECGQFKPREKFYKSPRTKSGVIPTCKECLYKIGTGYNEKTKKSKETKETIIAAMKKANLPFFDDLYDSCLNALTNEMSENRKNTAFTQMIVCLQSLPQYYGMTFEDSVFNINDGSAQSNNDNTLITEEDIIANKSNQETYNDYLQNKKDIKNLLGYDPFMNEAVGDQPLLYAQLIGILDASGNENDDMVRNASAIAIVRGFSQQSKIDNTIAKLMGDISDIEKNYATIKSLQDAKGKLTSTITNLAAESCISLKNNKNAKKGENTWTGKIKKIKDLDLREGRVNGFDIETSKAMKQVMDNSNRSIMEQLKLDESDWSDMVAEQREIIIDLQSKLDKYIEISRVLLSENLDLKDYLVDKNISIDSFELVDLESLYSSIPSDESEGT